MRLKHILPTTLFLLASGTLVAEGRPLSDIVSTVLIGGDILTKLMWAICIVMGIALIAASFTQFQIHRRNPKIVPLATPVMYLILGILAIAIPFLGQSMGFLSPPVQNVKGSAAPSQRQQNQNNKQQPQQYNPNDIDAPLY